jgi:hypothetical protein
MLQKCCASSNTADTVVATSAVSFAYTVVGQIRCAIDLATADTALLLLLLLLLLAPVVLLLSLMRLQ